MEKIYTVLKPAIFCGLFLYSGIYVHTFFTCGYKGDLAERMPLSVLAKDAQYMPGPAEVVVVDSHGFIEKCNRPESSFVVGIVSTNPAHTLRNMIKGSVPVALSGVVPCKVSNENGKIETGDLLVSASKPGYAMKAPPRLIPGTVLGKAMDPQEEDEDIITVLVMLR
jgi:hypothetical protein